jgi:putative heme-binding domain-containing protein
MDNPDPYVRILARAYFELPEVKKSYHVSEISATEGNFDDGRVQFYQNCIVCHSAGEGGGEFGPSLANIDRKFDRTELLNAIIDPDASMNFGYEPWLITTKDGEATFGRLLTNGEIVVIKDPYGDRHIFNDENIEQKLRLRTSIMPDPADLNLSDQDLADITRYLMDMNREEMQQ